MTTDTTTPAQTAAVYEPFNQPGRPFRQDSILGEATDWDLTRLALSERSFATYKDDPRADEARRIGEQFTAEEAQRVDDYLVASIQDTGHLDAIATAPELTHDDRAWLIAELRLAWERLDRLRDSVDHSGSLMNTSYASSSIDYVRWSAQAAGVLPLPGARPGRLTTQQPAPPTGPAPRPRHFGPGRGATFPAHEEREHRARRHVRSRLHRPVRRPPGR
ncbi:MULTISPECIES: hypothetical protein [Streptomycetaceae]|uniref:hypothetical protein n=1 Tax=Streptomycetaceae TaxID=2062 RepID=UPI00093C0797|nr:hypothetical protein [Streptomyces sp. CB02056]OKH97516.1 hypothetical protein AMK13_38010 [Streptomyces sp. CB02056]